MPLSNINIATLNARSVFKLKSIKTQKEFARFLRTDIHPKIDILCLQELSHYRKQTHLSLQDKQTLLSLFPNSKNIFSKHNAIIVINPDLNFINESISIEERIITATIINNNNNQSICQITNIYAPADNYEKEEFYKNILNNPQISNSSEPERHIILGDFNLHLYNHQHQSFRNNQTWINYLFTNFIDISSLNNTNVGNTYSPLPTFKRGNYRSTIDYIFASPALIPDLTNTRIDYIPQVWTDHHMISTSLNLKNNMELGPGSWRFNPQLLQDKEYHLILEKVLYNLLIDVDDKNINKQALWDRIKLKVKECTIYYNANKSKRYKTEIQILQDKRSSTTNLKDIASIEQKLDKLYELKTQQLIIRSNALWTEKGERNNKYFFNSLKTRSKQVTITTIQNHETKEMYSDKNRIIKEARSFYKKLYSTDSIDLRSIKVLTDNIPSQVRISNKDQDFLISPFQKVDILNTIQHSPDRRSPGLDGLGFEFYKLIIRIYPRLLDLFKGILDDAIKGNKPDSWKETRMILLYKKGDKTLLQNWRPLSLINCDAKIFTKMLANRLNQCLHKVINPYQTGFMPNRLISDNGWITQSMMTHLSNIDPKNESIGILLDQEKAYDRIHPLYLKKVMERFNFPAQFNDTIQDLFFQTKIHLSINGWIASPIMQQRGLRQGDPISPLLFNIAFEPLLRLLLNEKNIKGIPITKSVPSYNCPQDEDNKEDEYNNNSLKILAYADDLLIFIRNLEEWFYLKGLLQLYGDASNAKVNFQKTVMFSLTGTPHKVWKYVANSENIPWHDSNSPSAITYLGYPLYTNEIQLSSFLLNTENKLNNQINILKQRSLSIRGRSLIVNSLLLSRLWHILRVTIVPDKWLAKIKKKIYEYVVPFFPKPSYRLLCAPKNQGGINLININQQHKALHMVYIQKMLINNKNNFLFDTFRYYIAYYTKQSSVIPILLDPLTISKKFKKLPHMNHIINIISALPPIDITSHWPTSAINHIPLKLALIPNDRSRLLKNGPDIKKKVPSSWLVKNFNDPSFNKYKVYKEIISLLMFDYLKPLPQLSSYIFNPRINPNNGMETDIINYWYLSSNKKKPILVCHASPNVLRRFWRNKDPPIFAFKHPPLSQIPACNLGKKDWMLFWQLQIPHKAIEVWWRILINKLPTRSRLHHISPMKYQTSICAFCQEHENEEHFIMSCKPKKEFWKAIMFRNNIPQERLKNIWPIISFNRNTKPKKDSLILIGNIINTIWQHHWNSIFEERMWRTDWVLTIWLHFNTHNSNSLDFK